MTSFNERYAKEEKTANRFIEERDGKKEASAWPSNEHYEEHLEGLEELLQDTEKGVEWHGGQGEPDQKAKHQQLADDLARAIADARALEDK